MATGKKAGIWVGMYGDVRFAREADGMMYWSFGGRRGNVEYVPCEGIGEEARKASIMAICDAPTKVLSEERERVDRLVAAIREIAERENAAPVPIVREVVTPAETLPPGGLPAVRESGLVMVEVGMIDASPYQTAAGRGDPERDAQVGELAASIQAVGLAEPLVVRHAAGGRYELIAGHRRLAACRLAGLGAVPCLVRAIDDKLAEELHVVENLQRMDLTAIEEAASVERMLANGRTPEEVARTTGKSVRWVYRRASITKLTGGWRAAAERWGLSAAYLERVGRLPGPVQEEILRSMTSGVTEDYFARGGDVAVLDEEIEISLRRLSAAPWARMPGDPAKCGGCPDRSDARPDLFAEMEGEPRCLNKACWDKKVDDFVRSALKSLRAKHGQVIEARGNSTHLYREDADTRYSIPVVVVDGPSRAKIMWAPNKEAAAEAAGEKPKGLSARDLQHKAYVQAVAACIAGAGSPRWCDGETEIPREAIVAFAIGCGVTAHTVISGAYTGPLQRSVALCDKLTGAGGDDCAALWQAAQPNILKALDIESMGVTSTACEMLGSVALKVKEALRIPDALVSSFVAEFSPKKGKVRK